MPLLGCLIEAIHRNNHKRGWCMLSKMIVQMFQRFIEVVLWISLLGFVFAGWQYDGITTALAAFLAWVVFAIVFCGSFLLIADIQKSVEKIASSKQ
jgi:hypothetical protein